MELNYQQIYYIRNKKRINKRNNSNYLKNKVFILKKQKTYRENNKEKLKNYREKNRIKLLKYLKEYRKQNKDILKEKQKVSSKKWRLKNKEYVAKHKRERTKKDYQFKLRNNLARVIHLTLKGNNKSKRTLELLVCSLEFCKQHIENQFKEGMTWDNWGRGDNGNGMKKWNVDHIYPCASFDLRKPEEQEICFHWSNLQPLWAKENRLKWDSVV